MSHSRKLIYSLLVTLFVIVLFSLFNTYFLLLNTISYTRSDVLSSQNKKTLPPQSKSVAVVARVGGYVIEALTGWTSAYAEVNLTSSGLIRKTTADESGFFSFYSVPIIDNLGEFCLSSEDVNQLASFPICLAPQPIAQTLQLHDVLLSPTISLDTGKVPVGKTTKASGMTFPKSKVQVYLFSENNVTLWAKISASVTRIFPFLQLITKYFAPQNIYAAGFPIYETVSNDDGYFEFSLPSNFPSQNSIFVSSVFAESGNSPKSNTLQFQVLGLLGLIREFINNLINQFRLSLGNWKDPLFIVLIELLILIAIIIAFLIKGRKQSGQKTTEVLTEDNGNCLRDQKTIN